MLNFIIHDKLLHRDKNMIIDTVVKPLSHTTKIYRLLSTCTYKILL